MTKEGISLQVNKMSISQIWKLKDIKSTLKTQVDNMSIFILVKKQSRLPTLTIIGYFKEYFFYDRV